MLTLMCPNPLRICVCMDFKYVYIAHKSHTASVNLIKCLKLNYVNNILCMYVCGMYMHSRL